MMINHSSLKLFIDDTTLDAIKGQMTVLALACDMLAERVAASIAGCDHSAAKELEQ